MQFAAPEDRAEPSAGPRSTVVILDGHRVPVRDGETLFTAADRGRVVLPSSCRRTGRCRECVVELVAGAEGLVPRTAEERSLPEGFRLACRARVAGRAEVVRCRVPSRAGMQIETGAPHRICVAPPRPGSMLGLAVDIGTTTVVLRLADIERGAAIATRAFENPQRRWGSDVITRIRSESEAPDNPLRRALVAALQDSIATLPCDPTDIREIVLAGNTTMRDIVFGIDVAPVGRSPYRSVTETAWRRGEARSTALWVPATRLGLEVHPEARARGLPLLGGHVGADAAAALLRVDFLRGDGPAVLVDIGTNTEVVGRAGDRVLAASGPAGPAFEGGGVHCAMPALPGAVERIAVAADGSVELGVIGGKEPRGICGSGLVDALAELLRLGLVSATGRFRSGADRFVLSEEHGLFLTEADIVELLQAKAANLAAFLLVAEALDLGPASIRAVYLAGGFVRRMDLAAARRIGFLPDLPEDVFVKVGNAAIDGATEALLRPGRREQLEAFVPRVDHLRLESDPGFFSRFAGGCELRPQPLVRRPGR